MIPLTPSNNHNPSDPDIDIFDQLLQPPVITSVTRNSTIQNEEEEKRLKDTGISAAQRARQEMENANAGRSY